MSGLIWAEPPAARKSGPKSRRGVVAQPERSRRSPAILCLIDGYPTSQSEGREGSGITESMKQRLALLDRYPGRWALVGTEMQRDGVKELAGTRASTFAKYGYETATVNCKIYARKPHPSGLPIEALVKKAETRPHEPLPSVQPDSFGWSRDEINNALATARAWLFPTEGIQAA